MTRWIRKSLIAALPAFTLSAQAPPPAPAVLAPPAVSRQAVARPALAPPAPASGSPALMPPTAPAPLPPPPSVLDAIEGEATLAEEAQEAPAVPPAPVAPAMAAFPAIPAVPATPGMPPVPAVPGMAAATAVSRIPSFPAVPPVPAFPSPVLSGIEPPEAPEPPEPPEPLSPDPWLLAQVRAPEARDRMREMERRDRHNADSRTDSEYRRGAASLDRRDYDGAIEAFDKVIEAKGPRTDGAYYWRAYAQNKLGKRDAAAATIAELRKNFPSSHWLDDAKALEVEVRQGTGQPVSPEASSDEDLKLMALNSLVNSDPDRAVPILEKLLKSSNPPRVKERALFVLAQSHSPRGREVIAQVARGAYNPDLQLKAVEYLGVFGGKENQQALVDIYKNSSDFQVKRAILHGFLVCGCKDNLLAVAKTETNPGLRVDAIHQLGAMGASADLMQLYTPDQPLEVRLAVLQGLMITGNFGKMLEIAQTDRDVNMRREAIRLLGAMGRGKGGEGVAGLYSKETDPALKREVLNSLFVQGNAPALIAIAKSESDAKLKGDAVQKLSLMHSKESTDYLMELLNK